MILKASSVSFFLTVALPLVTALSSAFLLITPPGRKIPSARFVKTVLPSISNSYLSSLDKVQQDTKASSDDLDNDVKSVESFRDATAITTPTNQVSDNSRNNIQVEEVKVSLSTAEGSESFVNNGSTGWMAPYLDTLGLTEGKTVTYGVFASDVDESKTVSEEAAVLRRQEAAKHLENIGQEERNRRDQVGSFLWVVTGLYVVWSSLFADDGGFGGHLLRFLVVLPAFLALGYKRSAETGVCNIAQAGLWDVDGNGLKKIEDPTLAQAILDKVNNMNSEVLFKAATGATVFGLLPQSTTTPLVFFAVLFYVLYTVQGKKGAQ